MTETPSEDDPTPKIDRRAATADIETTVSSDYKVRGRKDAPDGTGVLGQNTATTGVGAGVFGQTDSQSDGTAGVYGEATAATGAAFGVRGVSNSNQRGGGDVPRATGVRGETTAGIGVHGLSEGILGMRAEAMGGGFNVGLFATHDGPDGSAVQSQSTYTDQAAETEGVWGRTDTHGDASQDLYPVGVRGTAHATTGTTLGVRGDINSRTGPGVVGVSATSGYTFSYSGTKATGVTGITDKTTDESDLDFVAGVEGVGTASGTSYGVFGRSTGDGYGLATPDDAKVGGSMSIGALGASAEQSTDITIGGTPTDVVYDSEVVDDRDEYDPTNGVYTCANDGSYHVKAQVFWEGGLPEGEGIRIAIRLNGFAETVDSVSWSNGNSRRTQDITTVLRNVAAGDEIKITAQTGGTNHDIVGITNRANLQISQIG